jgi:hypothetical protein
LTGREVAGFQLSFSWTEVSIAETLFESLDLPQEIKRTRLA